MLFALYGSFVFIVLPFALIAGWARYAVGHKESSTVAAYSLIGFSLATVSALLALGAFIYGMATGGFRHYDPRLMRIYALGCLLSLAAVIMGIAGVRRPHPLRWLSPFCALGTLLFWFISMSLE